MMREPLQAEGDRVASDESGMMIAADPVKSEEQAVAKVDANPVEAVEVEPDSIHPPPPRSLRLKVAPESLAPPLGVTAKLPAPQRPAKTLADLMTRKIITVRESEPIGNLEELMERFKFRHLPVVTADMKLVGLISLRDLLHAELGRMPDGTAAPSIDDKTLAGMIMRKNVVVAQLDMDLATACRVMLDKQLKCIPVVLEDHTLVGIVTETDFARLSLELLENQK